MLLKKADKIRPLGQRVLIQPIPEPGKSAGGIVIPDAAETKTVVGTVLALGDGEQETTFTGEWPPLKVGDHVLYGRYGGEEIRVEGVKEREWPKLLSINEIMGVVEFAGVRLKRRAG